MLPRVTLILVLLTGCLAWCQVEASRSETDNSADESQLNVPPPVSNQAYSSEFAGDTSSNFLRGGLTLSSAYSNNVTGGANPVGDMSYSFWPTIGIDKTTEQLHLLINYSPGFTIYQHTSSLNQANQNVGVSLQYRFTPRLTATIQEGFQKTSNVFDQPNPLAYSSVSGASPVSGAAIITPVAELLNNTTSLQVTYQVSPDGMIGTSGNFASLYYPNPSQVAGLFNTRSAGGSLFYSTRFHEKYYIGANYQYQNLLSYQTASPSTRTETQTIFVFLTAYLRPSLSLSISGGPQHYSSTQAPFAPSAAWSPMVMASLGWQGERTTLAASYSRVVTGGGGLGGAYHSNSGTASASWKLSGVWTAGVSLGYSNYNTVTPLFVSSSANGHSISGTASIQRALNDNINLQLGYSWVNQTYQSVSTSVAPNTNRVFFSINYQFTKPLHR